MSNPNCKVSVNEPASRFECEVAGRVCHLDYRLSDHEIFLMHTEVPPDLVSQGIGSTIVRFAVEYAREKGLIIHPYCSFVIGWLKRHPEFDDLVK